MLMLRKKVAVEEERDFIENCWSEDLDEKKGSFWKVAKDSLDMLTEKTDCISYEGKGRGAKYVWNAGT